MSDLHIGQLNDGAMAICANGQEVRLSREQAEELTDRLASQRVLERLGDILQLGAGDR